MPRKNRAMPTRRRNRTTIGPADRRELVPFAVVDRPPKDPPSVLSNPKRRLVVDLFYPSAGTTSAGQGISVAAVRAQILGQVGLPVLLQYFVLHRIHVWCQGQVATATQSQTTTSASLKLREEIFGVEDRDDPSPLANACCGIKYPLNVAPLFPPVAAANTLIATAFPQTAVGATVNLTVRLIVTYWGASTA